MENRRGNQREEGICFLITVCLVGDIFCQASPEDLHIAVLIYSFTPETTNSP